MAFLDFLPTIGGAIQTLWNSTVGQSQSKDLMRYQAELNQQVIDQQNRYNSPIAQMERLREAGLNPNLVYGNGVDGNQSSSPNVGIANRSPNADFGFAESVNNIFKRRQIENESALAEANVDQIRANRVLTLARYLDTMEDVKRKDATFTPFVQRAYTELDKMNSEIEVNQQRRDNIRQQTNNLEITANNLIEEGNYLAARTSLTKEQATTEVVRRASLKAGIYLTYRQAEEVAARIENIKSSTGLRQLEYEIKETEWLSSDELNNWLKDHPNVEMGVEVVDAVIDRISRVTGKGYAGRGKSTRRRNKTRR